MTDLQITLMDAVINSSGHFTILKFNTNWRVSQWTPNDRADIQVMAVGATLEEALLNHMVITAFQPHTLLFDNGYWTNLERNENKINKYFTS